MFDSPICQFFGQCLTSCQMLLHLLGQVFTLTLGKSQFLLGSIHSFQQCLLFYFPLMQLGLQSLLCLLRQQSLFISFSSGSSELLLPHFLATLQLTQNHRIHINHSRRELFFFSSQTVIQQTHSHRSCFLLSLLHSLQLA